MGGESSERERAIRFVIRGLKMCTNYQWFTKGTGGDISLMFTTITHEHVPVAFEVGMRLFETSHTSQIAEIERRDALLALDRELQKAASDILRQLKGTDEKGDDA